MKNFTILMLFMLLSSCSSVLVADEWPEKECAEYQGLIAGLVVASGETLEQADAANKAEEMDRAEELFEASLVFSQMAANHTVVYEQFCD
ncbi:MAG: hypothetical protein ACJ0G2_04020 [Gammaproteobacteria bacterium]|jgi:hypothetical protein|tara:strand:- start:1101 stop:1370 length:270 start_codon:yes stop_codon:yes gene_type:complete